MLVHYREQYTHTDDTLWFRRTKVILMANLITFTKKKKKKSVL